MAWGFETSCPDCGHGWGGVVASCRIGPESALSFKHTRNVFCPRCYLRLYFPKTLERAAWQTWCDAFVAGPQGRSQFLRAVVARVSSALAGINLRDSMEITLEEVYCPGCNGWMEPGSHTGDRLVCPQCGGRSAVVSEYVSHVQLFSDPEGWE